MGDSWSYWEFRERGNGGLGSEGSGLASGSIYGSVVAMVGAEGWESVCLEVV